MLTSPDISPVLHLNPVELEDWLGDLNPGLKEVIKGVYAVPSLATAVLGDKFQFERLGNNIMISLSLSLRWILVTIIQYYDLVTSSHSCKKSILMSQLHATLMSRDYRLLS